MDAMALDRAARLLVAVERDGPTCVWCGRTFGVQVVPTTGGEADETADLVHRLRAMSPHFEEEYGAGIAVTGVTAIGIDLSGAFLGVALASAETALLQGFG